jgi:hypothetical protein
MTVDRPIYRLRLQPQKNIDAIHALRRALKDFLRRYGLRCLSVEEEIPADAGTTTPDPPAKQRN